MTLVKLVKNKAYFKRFQTKFRRRREGKTDYKQRKALICQDKTKYNAAKYRLVVRISNKDIVCQIISSKIKGDFVFCSAYSHELKNYGLKLGLTNYPAAYCTGLLVARRLLQKLHLDKKYIGQNESVDGTYFLVSNEKKVNQPRPFKCNLDVGLTRTTTGNRVFGALKGACDGGLYIPHSEEGKRFPGWDKKEQKYEPNTHKKYIFGGHVADYMRLIENDQQRYKTQFGRFIKEGIKADNLEQLYASVHSAIRKNPKAVLKHGKTLTKEEKQKKKKKIHLIKKINFKTT